MTYDDALQHYPFRGSVVIQRLFTTPSVLPSRIPDAAIQDLHLQVLQECFAATHCLHDCLLPHAAFHLCPFCTINGNV